MALSDKELKEIAYLARINVKENSLKKLKKELEDILNLFEELNLADTNSVEAMSHPLDLSQPTRKDLVTEEDLREELQKNAPSVQSGLFLVPKVIEGED
ncbi:MAG: Asp-tRNA(Asn)/Glu-tRNA(Gln) amidotransferase subunit GatC [Pseudomonadota bacterium]|jgi:aspartyl-tRNA(Asn)/glutamyl-tRNA(Gln) amidotransferase subunit C|nr:Asp-tRNA(Asn)/Glu-tRNA(Gln) amidotransferase subunit GatC [Pseudomonadota bacterium]MEC8449034.1 Asp-tRNA(Asn)/Glu-tRNA(Gln) amidotransferase subunit GatC [Pseudomonadota bacterium]MEC8798564.1 Asp-tRNA(Asn)/Glu-tRNA(Gln) amidotransferase subunit GatC [Pseudomonadota bacterium]MED5349643.1 Asp-tRNA(Asn)/Glu-tRNA(Gln) amidotransferase subunit GatC [Pseudomonadota bacterium]GIR88245.1 MAG: glutamyl-tRNA(Gln) amidotransferase subunit C [Gammaproteobacteria bacterium]|tara:strand:- start:300 stop:596 length:297 start_codon:yes stop_codon:yes gene_type:complete